ncbi:MAG: CBS domain-containing protein [Candidatus Micrarchaeota archaeon]|nr:CBS domain-containing protein [Candidatus Micrarchaeota archaeon]
MAMNIKVSECMTVGVFTLPASKTVLDAARLLRKTNVGSVIITQKGKAKGIITERDIVYKVVAAGKNPAKTKLKSVMSKPLKVIRSYDSVDAAAEALRVNKVKRLPVIDKEGRLVGIITEGDLLRVYPGMVDVVLEMQQLRQSKPNEIFTGVCESCGCYAEDLKRSGGKLRCEECIEEEEV